MKYCGLYLTLILLVVCSSMNAQQSLKLDKQQTSFFYTQLNLHGGYISDVNGSRWDVTNRGPNNQMSFQYLKKNKRVLQKGYIKSIAPTTYSLKFSIPFNKTVNLEGESQANFKLMLLDTWVKFGTKWDRTSVWVGNKSIPYGHNPKLDPVSSFMTNLIKMDIGFVQDLGVFIKTPVNKKLDLELSVTSGGLLNKPILICDNIIINSSEELEPTFSFVDYDFNDTWLVTSRLGNQSFNKNEVGLIGVSGKISNVLVPNDFVRINRIGGDWIHKHQEKMKFGNQLALGFSDSDAEGSFATLNYQGSADFYLIDKVVLSASIAGNYQNSVKDDAYHFNLTNAASITYVVSPHTRFRINQYQTRIFEADEVQWGVLFQFVTGLGKRN